MAQFGDRSQLIGHDIKSNLVVVVEAVTFKAEALNSRIPCAFYNFEIKMGPLSRQPDVCHKDQIPKGAQNYPKLPKIANSRFVTGCQNNFSFHEILTQ